MKRNNPMFCEITGAKLPPLPPHWVNVPSLMSIPEVRELIIAIKAISFTDPTSWDRVELALAPFEHDSHSERQL